MPNFRTIATSTAQLVLLLSCNRILPTKAYTDDDIDYTDDDGYSYSSETTSNLNVTCASADPSVFTSPVCYTLVSSNGTESINGTVIYFWEEHLYEFYGPELEGGPVNASVDKRIGGAVNGYFLPMMPTADIVESLLKLTKVACVSHAIRTRMS
jgi:hypothetical protein